MAYSTKWFKHVSLDNGRGVTGALIERKDLEACCFYLAIVELVHQNQSLKKRGEAEVPWTKICKTMHMSARRAEVILNRISSISKIEVEKTNKKNVRIFIPSLINNHHDGVANEMVQTFYR